MGKNGYVSEELNKEILGCFLLWNEIVHILLNAELFKILSIDEVTDGLIRKALGAGEAASFSRWPTTLSPVQPSRGQGPCHSPEQVPMQVLLLSPQSPSKQCGARLAAFYGQ